VAEGKIGIDDLAIAMSAALGLDVGRSEWVGCS
jgi:hypothetical protein